jgi:hypothetical protein
MLIILKELMILNNHIINLYKKIRIKKLLMINLEIVDKNLLL